MKKQNTIGRGSLWAVLLFATVISSCKKEKTEELPEKQKNCRLTLLGSGGVMCTSIDVLY